MPVVAPRVIVAELSRMPTRPMTTPPLGTATVALAEKTCELVVQFVIAPVTVRGVPHTSPAAFCQSWMTAPAISFAAIVVKAMVGSVSPVCQSRYQAMTFMDPVPLPLVGEPTASSAPPPVQPDTAAVIAKSFHVAKRNIRSPAAGEPGMATVPSAIYPAPLPAVFRESATSYAPLGA